MIGFIKRKAKLSWLYYQYIKYKQRQAIVDQEKVAQIWRAKIVDYLEGKIEEPRFSAKKPELVGKKIIWQYWGQGLERDSLPEVILPCFESVDKHKGEYEVIRLDNSSIADYIDLPQYVYERLKDEHSGYGYVFLSDLIRLALLVVYGGVWMDATIYMTGPIPSYCFDSEFFMYQRDYQEDKKVKRFWTKSYYAYWGWSKDFKVCQLNAFIVANEVGNKFLTTCLALLLDYWKTDTGTRSYFFFQILLCELTRGKYAIGSCPVVSDVLPHLLSVAIAHPRSYIKASQALKTTTIHKLNSKGVELNSIVNFLWLQRMQYQDVL